MSDIIFLKWNGHLRVWIWYQLLQHSAFFMLHVDMLLCARYIGQDSFGYRDRNPIKTSLSKITTKNNFGEYVGLYIYSWKDETNV